MTQHGFMTHECVHMSHMSMLARYQDLRHDGKPWPRGGALSLESASGDHVKQVSAGYPEQVSVGKGSWNMSRHVI